MKNRLLMSLVVLVSFGWFITGLDHLNKSKPCVNVYIDFGSLDNNSKMSKCVPTEKDTGLNILQKSGINLEGTNKYGLKVICRVNNLPTTKQESCATMPPADAYWAFITKEKSGIVNPMPKWGWAQKGISEVYFNPGDSLGLIFTEKGKVRWPD